MRKAISTKNLSREDWLKIRKTGIGGSDVAGIVGVSPFSTALSIYNDKTNDTVEELNSEALYWGTTLEDVVAKEFQRRSGLKVQRTNYTFISGHRVANIDRAVVNTDIAKRVIIRTDAEGNDILSTDTILECKTCSAFKANQWGPSQESEIKERNVVTSHQIPVYYETQVQWYMGTLGVKRCYVAVLIGGNDFRMYQVDFSESVFNTISKMVDDFWAKIEARTPPEPSNTREVIETYLNDNGDLMEADNYQTGKIAELREEIAAMDEHKKRADKIKEEIALTLGERTGITINGEKAITFKSQDRRTFDTKTFKKDHPEMVEQYEKISTTRVMRIY